MGQPRLLIRRKLESSRRHANPLPLWSGLGSCYDGRNGRSHDDGNTAVHAIASEAASLMKERVSWTSKTSMLCFVASASKFGPWVCGLHGVFVA